MPSSDFSTFQNYCTKTDARNSSQCMQCITSQKTAKDLKQLLFAAPGM